MKLRDKLRARVQPMLEPGETIESVFLAQTGPNPNLAFLSALFLLWAKYDVIAVTDRRIGVFRTRALTAAKPRELVASYPREERVAPEQVGLWNRIELGGTKYWVHQRFKGDLAVLTA